MHLHSTVSSSLAIVICLCAACSSDGNDCDPGQTLIDNVCQPTPASTPVADSSTPDTASPTDAAGADELAAEVGPASEAAAPGNWGAACTQSGVSAECQVPSDYCAIQPGTTAGYCTAINCTTNATLCPAGWTCFDVTVMNFCMKP
jgi:hypothetical protein